MASCDQHSIALMLTVSSACMGLQAAEVFNGVPLEIAPPFLHEKRAMQLHEVLTPQQTQVLAQALDRIAATVNEAHSASLQEHLLWRKNTSAQAIELRNALHASGVDPHLGLAVKQIHRWKISAHHIQFDVDYYLPNQVGKPPEIYRDRYALTLSVTSSGSSSGWHFSGHPNDAPIGKLSCQYINALWSCPDTP